MGGYMLQMFGVSLLLTIVIEGIVALCWGLRSRKKLQLVLLVNILTNPAAVLVYWLYQVYVGGTSLPVQIVIEIVVVAVEAWIYRGFAGEKDFQMKRPVLFAIVANGLSWGMGGLL